MRRVRESLIESKVVKWAKARKILPLKMTPFQDGGWPDHLWLFTHPGIAFIEFKAPGEVPEPRQEARIRELQRRGYPVKVVTDYDDGIAFLEAAVLSARRCETWDFTSMRWIPLAAGNGQDDDSLLHR